MSRSDAALKRQVPRALAITICLLAIVFSLSSGLYITSETYKKRQAEQMSTAELQKLADEHSGSPWVHYTLGVRLARTMDLPPAARALESAAKLKPDSYDIQYALGRCLAFMHAGDRAEKPLMDAIALKPDEGGPYVYLTMARHQQDHTELAIESAKKAVQLDPKNPEAWYQYGILYTAALGNEAEGAPHLKKAVELAPESGVYNFAYGTMLADLSQFVEAAPYLRKAVKLLPANSYAHFMLAVCMHRNGAVGVDADFAIAELKQAILLSPNDYRAHFELGNMLEERSDFAAALAEFESAVKLNPRLGEIWFHLSRMADRSNQPLKAASARAKFQEIRRLHVAFQTLARHLRDHPEDVAAQVEIGDVLMQQGSLKSAMVQFEDALRRQPNNMKARTLLEQTRHLMAEEATKQGAKQ